MTLIRFGCSIRIPDEGNFTERDRFNRDPEQFLKDWIEANISMFYTGPLINKRDEHDGHLLIVPVVRVKYIPNKL